MDLELPGKDANLDLFLLVRFVSAKEKTLMDFRYNTLTIREVETR